MESDLLEDAADLAAWELRALHEFEGSPEAFWALCLQALAQATGARRALLLSSAVGRPWRARAQWPAGGVDAGDDAQRSLRLLARAQDAPLFVDEEGGQRDLALRLSGQADEDGQVLVALLLGLERGSPAQLTAMADAAGALAARFMARQPLTPAQAARSHTGPAQAAPAEAAPGAPLPEGQALERAERLHDILRLARTLSREKRFTQAAMALCNQLCSRFGAERVSLGWRQGSSLRLVAISHVEQFDAKSQLTRALEELMEEALEQEAVLTYPAPAQAAAVLRAHQAYAQAVGADGALALCTVPLDGPEGVPGVLCLERREGGFSPAEVWELSRAGEAATPWLAHLHLRDRWFGARLWQGVQAQARALVGPRHTAWKAAGLLGAVLLILACLLPWAYRVDASLAVRSRDLLFMPAPFDGYLRQVHVDVGDQVATGFTLLELDTRDLLLEESMAEADLQRYTREAEKAMAARQLAEMQIALARQQQALAKLELTRFQLANAQVKAPFAGVVIEGELKKNLGAPVRKGDLLVKLAQTSRTYLELEIDQAHVHEVAVGTRGEFALVGRPGERYPIVLSHLDPAAVSKDGRTVYLARARLEGPQEADWRPGMGGNAKLDAGQRPLIWVLTHRTVRFLREYFWL